MCAIYHSWLFFYFLFLFSISTSHIQGKNQSTSNTSNNNTNNNSSNNKSKDEKNEIPLPPELEHCDRALVDKILAEIVVTGQVVTFEEIAGLEFAKKCVNELICW